MSSQKIVDLRQKKVGIQEHVRASSVRAEDTYERPKSNLRARRRHARIIGGIFLVIGCVFCVWGIHALSYLPRFSIAHFTVSGARTLSDAEIERVAETIVTPDGHAFFSHENLWLYPRDSVEVAIRNTFPRIATVHLSRASYMTQTVDIVVAERIPYARWCADNSCFFVDSTGYIFGEAATSSRESMETTLFFGPLASSTLNPVGQTYASGYFTDLRVLIMSTRIIVCRAWL